MRQDVDAVVGGPPPFHGIFGRTRDHLVQELIDGLDDVFLGVSLESRVQEC